MVVDVVDARITHATAVLAALERCIVLAPIAPRLPIVWQVHGKAVPSVRFRAPLTDLPKPVIKKLLHRYYGFLTPKR